MTRKIKVLLLVHELVPTGAPKVVLSAFERFADQVELRTVSYLGGPLAERFRRRGPVQTLIRVGRPDTQASPGAWLGFLRDQTFSLVRARLWADALARWKPDVVYVNSVAGLLIARRLRLLDPHWKDTPVLLHVHELDSVLTPFAAHSRPWLRDLPRRYLAVSEATAEALVHRYGVPADKVSVVPAFVDEWENAGNPTPKADSGPMIVGGAGVVCWRKNTQFWLLMAAETKRLLGAGRVRFVWLGAGAEEEAWQFREMARKLNLADDVELLPFMPRPETHFAQFDVFALTSWEETAALVALETMLLEKPVVCFAGTGGTQEFVGETGIILPEFSPGLMAQAVADLAADPARRAALGRAARKRVQDTFTTAQQAPRILAEIQRLAHSERIR